jgi:hypothetical protein
VVTALKFVPAATRSLCFFTPELLDLLASQGIPREVSKPLVNLFRGSTTGRRRLSSEEYRRHALATVMVGS